MPRRHRARIVALRLIGGPRDGQQYLYDLNRGAIATVSVQSAGEPEHFATRYDEREYRVDAARREATWVRCVGQRHWPLHREP